MSAPGEPTTIRLRISQAIRLVELGMSGPALVHLDCALAILDNAAPRDEGGHIVLTSERTHRLVPDPVRLVGRVQPRYGDDYTP